MSRLTRRSASRAMLALRRLVGFLILAATVPLAAQSLPETVRGRAIDDSGHVVSGASVHVTRGPDRLVQQTTTDSAGRFSMRFDPGTGDYLVAVAATGFRPARRREVSIISQKRFSLIMSHLLSRRRAAAGCG